MPHLTLEYPTDLAGFSPEAVVAALNAAAFESGLFGEDEIKTRAYGYAVGAIGIHALPRRFLHVTVALLPGRQEADRQALTRGLLAVLTRHIPADGGEIHCTVETRELHATSYVKEVCPGC